MVFQGRKSYSILGVCIQKRRSCHDEKRALYEACRRNHDTSSEKRKDEKTPHNCAEDLPPNLHAKKVRGCL